ncbi:mismatch-specific DNA-glycosylase [Nocardioides sp. NPDC092400]|uniref:mismatch-specific DNA-glycosylase n=1 Tax=Nocardioides sp. NPDC092400 TaxID=3155196 RepID=UPI00343242A2
MVLPPIVAPEPVAVFCGLAGAASTKHRDHYYEGPGNSFWQSLHRAGFTPRELAPHEDRLLAEPVAGTALGLTDLVGHWDPRWVEIDRLVEQVEQWEPEWLAITGKGAAHEASKALGRRGRPHLGVQDWYVGPAQVFVLPGPSGANQRRDYDGRPNRLSWWRDLAMICGVPGGSSDGSSDG